MTVFKKTRIRLGEWSLKKDLPNLSRKPHLINLKHAMKIGIMTDVPANFNPETINRFCRSLDNHYKTYNIIAYYDTGKAIVPVFPVKDYIICFNHKNLDWMFKPKHPDIQTFINTKFDILLDLSMNDHFPLKYITSKSQAGVKLSRYSIDSKADIMIQIDKNSTQEFLIEQIDYYLDMLTNYKK